MGSRVASSPLFTSNIIAKKAVLEWRIGIEYDFARSAIRRGMHSIYQSVIPYSVTSYSGGGDAACLRCMNHVVAELELLASNTFFRGYSYMTRSYIHVFFSACSTLEFTKRIKK